jgi:hypothetical protein
MLSRLTLSAVRPESLTYVKVAGGDTTRLPYLLGVRHILGK